MRSKLTVTVVVMLATITFPSGLSLAEEAEPMVTQGVFSVPVSRAEVAQDWNMRGYDCTAYVTGKNWTSSHHSHFNDELVIVIEGQIELIVGEQRFAGDPGDEIFIPANTMHWLENRYDGQMVMLFGLKSPVGKVGPSDTCVD